LPLPRTVGVETDCDLLCLRVVAPAGVLDSADLAQKLNNQLPRGCEVVSIDFADHKVSLHPCEAEYELKIARDALAEIENELKAHIEHLLASNTLNLERRTPAKGGSSAKSIKSKNVDVRPFIKSIKLNADRLTIVCNIIAAGSVRVDEIYNLLKLDTTKLAAPLRRKNVQWNRN